LAATGWTFLTNHGRVLLCIARDPGMRLRDIAASLGITERSAFGIVTDLTEAGYIVKQRDGRRNRYEVQAHLPLREPTSRERTIGEMLTLLADSGTAEPAGPAGPAERPGTAGPAGTTERARRGT
jgi:DNA-binding transcriptional ArsR family regulator